MGNKVAVLGVNDNAICFDFKEKLVYFFRKGWASKTLKLVDIAIPFDRITAVELIRPTTWEAGRIALIVDGTRLLAEDQFDNNASELSLGDGIYPAVAAAVECLLQMCPEVELVTEGKLAVPGAKDQSYFATEVTYKEFVRDCDKESITKTGGISVGMALVILAVCIVVIVLAFKSLL